eukprot:1986690-Alexandrium_andersonii.AAC.1
MARHAWRHASQMLAVSDCATGATCAVCVSVCLCLCLHVRVCVSSGVCPNLNGLTGAASVCPKVYVGLPESAGVCLGLSEFVWVGRRGHEGRRKCVSSLGTQEPRF